MTNVSKVLTQGDQFTCADLIVEYIHALEIAYVFGVPGGAIEPFFNALGRSERNNGPKIIVARHECGAAFMADGYSRETGKMGVVCSTTGPGATNLVTGVSSAFSDEVPMLVITAQTNSATLGRRALQESSCMGVDIVAIFKCCTKLSTLVSHATQLENKLRSAIMLAHQHPKGPVHLSIPADILDAVIFSQTAAAEILVPETSLMDEHAITQLSSMLEVSNKVVVYIGRWAGNAAKQIIQFCELSNIPFITDQAGKAYIDETHYLYRGVYGFAGHQSAKMLLCDEQIDLILAVGTVFDELATNSWNSSLLNDNIVHVDSVAEHFTQSPAARLHVCGSLEKVFSQLIHKIDCGQLMKHNQQQHIVLPAIMNPIDGYFSLDESTKCLVDSNPVKPQRLMRNLANCLPAETRLYVDAGAAWSWATHYYNTKVDQGFYRIATGFGAMTWAVGAAIGSSIANRMMPTVCLVGDGAYLMAGQEITVADQHCLPVVFIVLNDAALGMVKHGQRMAGAESLGWQLNDIDYASLAQSMGVNGLTVCHAEELNQIDYQALFALNGPTLIDVKIDSAEIPPMAQRVSGLKCVVNA